MNQNTERSFVATLKTNYGNLHLPKLTYKKTTKIKTFDYDPFKFDTHIDVSSYLCVKGDAPSNKIKFYFYCIDDYYSIYLMTDDFYHRQALSNEHKDFIGAFPPDREQTTYNLINQQGKIITLDQLEDNAATIRIQTRGGKTLSVRGNTPVGSLVCTESGRAKPLQFTLDILSRGAA